MPRTKHSYLLLLCLLVSACSPQAAISRARLTPSSIKLADATVTPTPTEAPTRTPSPLPPSSTPAPSATLAQPSPTSPPQPASGYTFHVAFQYDQKSADVEEKVDYTNSSPDALPDLRLVIPPLAYQGSFTLKTILWADGTRVQNTSYGASWLVVPLSSPLQPGASLSLSISYHLALPAAASLSGSRPVPFGYTTRQANLVDWYPFIPPYISGAGWLAHPFSAYGESMVYAYSNFDITLQVSGGNKNLVIAASASAEMNAGMYHYLLIGARTFALSFSQEYQTSKLAVGDIELTSYAFPAHGKAGKAAPQIAANALSLFQDRFGPYPHKTLAIVEADFLDGMEYDGLIFVSKAMFNLFSGKPDDYFTTIVAHETAHQWWFARVGNDQAMEPWLDEALSTYCELLYDEKFAPEAVKWWWDIRVNYYHPAGPVDSSVYDQQGHPNSYEMYRNAVYLNGAVFLNDLREAVGDESFFAFLRDYAEQFGGKIATRQDFFSVLRMHTQADITPLIKKYFSK